jgi:hypothetical protein
MASNLQQGYSQITDSEAETLQPTLSQSVVLLVSLWAGMYLDVPTCRSSPYKSPYSLQYRPLDSSFAERFEDLFKGREIESKPPPHVQLVQTRIQKNDLSVRLGSLLSASAIHLR